MTLARVLEASAAGENVMYGDAGRRAVLEAAGGARAKALVISYAKRASRHEDSACGARAVPKNCLSSLEQSMNQTWMLYVKQARQKLCLKILEGSLMLASHALVLLGVPLNRVVKRIRMFREERYKNV